MARTAPVPDIPPIPGMCPSIAVLAGGGDGGGGGGDGAGDGSGDQNAGAGAGGEGADGDGRSAGGCGVSGSGGCSVHSHTPAAGHPVDVVTGRAYTDPVVDLFLPGPIDLAFRRSYSSTAAERDIGLGFGWSHSLAWQIEVGRRSVTVHTQDARVVEMNKPEEGGIVLGQGGWVLHRQSWGYTLHTGEDHAMIFSAVEDDGKRYLLTALVDRNSNRVALTYEDGKLVEVIDGAGRVVRVRWTPEGRIAALDVRNAVSQAQWVTVVRYRYDTHGDLTEVEDAAGHVTSYTYDDHLMTSERAPTGLTFHFVYDTKRRCVETWGDYPGRTDPSLMPDLPKLLNDKTTPAKGIYHCKLSFHEGAYTEVDDSTRTRRFLGNAFGKVSKAVEGSRATTRSFDDQGNVLTAVDPCGAITVWEYDARGNIIKQTDAMGGVSWVTRDAAGNVLEYTDEAGRTATYLRDRNGNVLERRDFDGRVYTYQYDTRGLVTEERAPNGGRTLFRYDGHGNLIELTLPNGALYRFTFDWFGRRTSVIDPTGGVRRYVYDNTGNLTQMVETDGTASHYHYDSAGNLLYGLDADGKTWRYEHGGFNVLTAIQSPDGGVIRIQYDREGRVVRVVNEKGEVQAYERDVYGDIVEERTFDGLARRWRRDAMGRTIRYQDDAGHLHTFTRDLLGRVVEVEYDDGTVQKRSYDATGLLTEVSLDGSEVRFERDPMGRILTEEQVLRGDAHRIEIAYDVMGDEVSRRSSLGMSQSVERDVMGARVKTRLGPAFEILHEKDIMGQEIKRHLPGGGRIESLFDERRRLRRRRAVNPSQGSSGAPGEPQWVGLRDDGSTLDRAYTYSPLGNVLRTWDKDRGTTEYDYDPIGRLLASLPEGAPGERFSYDATGNVVESGVARAYGPGNRLLRRGDTDYVWDKAGFLSEKVVRGARGEERWRYEWNAQGLLRAVDTPDGSRVALEYDAFARRLEKRVTKDGDLLRRTRFVWDGHLLAHEIREIAAADGDQIVEERTYTFEDKSESPMAQLTRSRATPQGDLAPSEEEWVHYVNDPNGTPEALVGRSGDVVWRADRTVWGERRAGSAGDADTPIGFAGQYYDEETGLYYNRYRYYDPEACRFVSRDPIELRGGINVYSYEVNPLSWIDPLGLAPHTVTADIDGTPLRPASGANGFDSTMSGAEFDALRARHNPGGSEALDRRLCHTEHKACEAARNAPIQPGQTLNINNGTEPPCVNCRGAMNDLAAGSRCNVNYNWTDAQGQQRTWSTTPERADRSIRNRNARNAAAARRAAGGS